jgi:hypothetical protein
MQLGYDKLLPVQDPGEMSISALLRVDNHPRATAAPDLKEEHKT